MTYGKVIKNFEIAKTSPTARWTDPASYATWDKVATSNEFSATNQIIKPAGPGSDVVFDGSNDYIAVANESNFDFERTDTFSIAAWIKCTASGVYHNIFVKANDFSTGNYAGYWFRVDTNNHVDMQLYDVNTSATDYIGRCTTDTVTDGNWHFVVATYSGNSSATGIKVYIDGVQKDTTNTGGGSFGTRSILNNQTPRIGGNALGGSFTGSIDEPLVFAKVLSGAEITALYNSGVGVRGDIANAPFTTSFRGGWHLDEASGTSAADFSGNSNTGTLTNGPTWGTGIVPGATALSLAKFISSIDGTGAGENGIHIFGVNDGRGVINGATTEERIASTAYGFMDTTGNKKFTRGLFVDGGSDIVQSRIQAHSTQTSNLSTWENSAGTVGASMSAAYLFSTANVLVTGLTASRVTVTDGSKQLASSSVTSTELGYVSGVTSAIQTQLNAITTGFFKLDQSTPQTVTEGTTMPTFASADADKDVGLNFNNAGWDNWRVYNGGGDNVSHFRDFVIRNTTNGVDGLAIQRDGQVTLVNNLKLGTAGAGVYIKEGSNATMGTATLTAGTVTVSTTKVTANSRIFLTVNGGTLTNVGAQYISARTAGTSFVITSLNILDSSNVAWIIVEPA